MLDEVSRKFKLLQAVETFHHCRESRESARVFTRSGRNARKDFVRIQYHRIALFQTWMTEIKFARFILHQRTISKLPDEKSAILKTHVVDSTWSSAVKKIPCAGNPVQHSFQRR